MRTVVVLFGPPGAGKSTLARSQTELTVYDRDDEEHASKGEAHFRQIIAALARDPAAQAVVIRAGGTSQARRTAIRTVDATHAFLLMPDEAACHQQAGHRRRTSARKDHAAITSWFGRFDHTDAVRLWPGSWDDALAMIGMPIVPAKRGKAAAAEPRGPGRSGRPWQRARKQVLSITDVCYLCGHHGSQDVDHVEPLAHGGAPLDPHNLGPIHGGAGCPTCGRKCNQEKGDKPLSAVVRLKTSADWYSPLARSF